MSSDDAGCEPQHYLTFTIHTPVVIATACALFSLPVRILLYVDPDRDGNFCSTSATVPASHLACVLANTAPRVPIRPISAHARLGPTSPARWTRVLVIGRRACRSLQQLAPYDRRASETNHGVKDRCNVRHGRPPTPNCESSRRYDRQRCVP